MFILLLYNNIVLIGVVLRLLLCLLVIEKSLINIFKRELLLSTSICLKWLFFRWNFELVFMRSNKTVKLMIFKGVIFLQVIVIVKSSFFRWNLFKKSISFFSSCTHLSLKVFGNISSYWVTLLGFCWARVKVVFKGSILAD